MNPLLPASEKRKHYELRALGLRDFAGVEGDQPLDPFALAEFAKLLVVDFDQIKGLSDESRQHLLGEAADEWSGGACSRPLPNGWKIVILNPAHGTHRNRATLMEEISHVFLGHQANRLAVVKSEPPAVAGGPTTSPKVLARDYNKSDEEEAYAVGAAALVPFAALRRAVLAGHTSEQIARRFGVSRQLVEYRIKVTHLWAEYKDTSTSRAHHV
ncbi:MAG TPA: ImmA/IrrE family metallo-endopeptidase [Pyrinomonadaceae bacterium]|nr:ImmA/IrrE family metallo-endopeptidase [Pyrinomonadaceae bacterium]